MPYEERRKELQKLQRIASSLDSSIPLPGGYRVGLDGLVGLIPVLGDSLTTLFSSFIVLRGAQLGVPTHHLVRMMLNVLLEAAVGIVPVIGNLFDFVWKANEKNMRLIERHLPEKSPSRSTRKRLSYAAIGIVLAFLSLIAILIVIGFRILLAAFAMLSG
jgi:hypothetical protein